GRTVRKLSKEETGKQISALKKRTGISKIEISVQETDRRALRAETLGAVMRSIAAAVIWITTTMMILRELGVNLAAIGLSLSIIGVALGFGSQSLVKDCLSGIFMILEDQYGVGDLIDAEVATGTVEGLGLRTLRLRDSDGTVWHIPNGEIRRVGNKSKQRTNP
ncbi:MAG: mechanosensitive ion channel, partial [Acidimicrobiia bacterium]|nr:mechanosensitive ion channel [Acidimicrobiia bacterium]